MQNSGGGLVSYSKCFSRYSHLFSSSFSGDSGFPGDSGISLNRARLRGVKVSDEELGPNEHLSKPPLFNIDPDSISTNFKEVLKLRPKLVLHNPITLVALKTLQTVSNLDENIFNPPFDVDIEGVDGCPGTGGDIVTFQSPR